VTIGDFSAVRTGEKLTADIRTVEGFLTPRLDNLVWKFPRLSLTAACCRALKMVLASAFRLSDGQIFLCTSGCPGTQLTL
ncbi:hypothetical protein STEG23_014396, partial [Scotinomys teguina]